MKYLSVCSGIEAATVAWHSLGWTPLAFSEIEAFPRAVLQHHYPDVPLYGDFTKLRDEPIIEDADILVGGTPCQAFSVAGLRKSLEDDRGNLTLEFVRLADAIDNARLDRGKPASIIVWENVPGVLSVKDNAFGCFLSALAGDDTPYVPPRGKWTNAGLVAGPKRTVAWRVLDAQYFGLAQRRRRVFVVASAGDGFDPAEVLLECESVRRDTPPRREKGQDAAGGATGRAGERSHWDGDGHPHPTLNQSAKSSGGVGASNQELFSQRGAYLVGEPATRDTVSTLTARGPYSLGIPEVDGGQIVPMVASAITAAMGGSPTGHNREDNFVVTHATLDANNGPRRHNGVVQHMDVRRLTPVECERLQGFPDGYTAIPWRGKPAADCPDGPRYKALGNSMAVTCMRWIGKRIARS
jgi:DNA (cytosine-5)-methyltransferase 1